MAIRCEIKILPDHIYDREYIEKKALEKSGIEKKELKTVSIIKKSVDARRKDPVFVLQIEIITKNSEEVSVEPVKIRKYPDLRSRKVVIAGSGPAGMFAALRLTEYGIKPLIIERGRDVQSRKEDIKALMHNAELDSNSNFCYGEGGAGTFTDGKLYTRSGKNKDIRDIKNILVKHGASKNINIDSKPHIGSDVLPDIVASIRTCITERGGEFLFSTRLTDLKVEKGILVSVFSDKDEMCETDALILAAGHSARDVYGMLYRRGLQFENKGFAVGVRIEHPQRIIDSMQYHSADKHPNLPSADYNFACQVGGKGVYTFCMCPGGYIVPAMSGEGEMLINGMSESSRNSGFANAGIVVTVGEEDWSGLSSEEGFSPSIAYQRDIESKAYSVSGSQRKLPGQRMTDFIKGRVSADLPETSYFLGNKSADMKEIFPSQIYEALRSAIKIFSKNKKAFYTEEAAVYAAETRTSSPLRITRDRHTLMHPAAAGLFPSGEGAGYSGGIISSALDGRRTADAVVEYLKKL